ncbi:hypothetical protein CW368_12175 [Actinomycetales bacterium SN12]|nr:hypothetical protein CW368_12175 [Actinomycetales bacterium SN12]
MTINPDQVSCDAASAHGLAISNDPQGRFSVRLGSDRRGSVGAGSAEGLVLFEGTELDLTASGAVLTIGESEGEVSLVEGWAPGDDVNVAADDAERYPARLSGTVACESPITLATPDPGKSGSAAIEGVSVRFMVAGAVHTAVFVPTAVSCAGGVTATGVEPYPGTFFFDDSGLVRMTVSDDAGTTEFRADDVSVVAESNGSYRLQGIRGDVQFWEGQTGGTLSPDEAEAGTGTLSALIICP